MCARITLTTTSTEIADLFGLTYDLSVRPRHNMAPSQPIPVVRTTPDGKRELVHMRWGLVPHWTRPDRKVTGYINARAETVLEKPAFRDPFRFRRCLVPADGFYEWKHVGKRKQPYFFRRAGGGPLAYAAVWDTWAGPDETFTTVAVLTTPANELVRPLHERMPAIVPPEQFAEWLNPRQPRPETLLPLLRPFPADRMEMWPVSDRVNVAAVDEPGLTSPVVLPPAVSWVQPSLFEVA